jgi:hypothetical protein
VAGPRNLTDNKRWPDAARIWYNVRLPYKRLFRRALALAIAIAQAVVIVATATEPLHASASAHIERSGTRQHFAHNEATCSVCAAQSMHAQVKPCPPPALMYEQAVVALPARIDGPISNRTLTANGSRAPPALS